MIVWSCNNATQSHDQGWHSIFQPSDPNGHQCFSFSNERAQEVPNIFPPLARVFGVSNAVRSNGTSVILWDYFRDSSGNATHPDQIWCAY